MRVMAIVIAVTTLGFAASHAGEPAGSVAVPKTTSEATGGNPWNERAVVVRAGETLAGIMREFGSTVAESNEIASLVSFALRPGDILQVLLSPADAGRRLRAVRVVVQRGADRTTIAWSDTGRYVRVEVGTPGAVPGRGSQARRGDRVVLSEDRRRTICVGILKAAAIAPATFKEVSVDTSGALTTVTFDTSNIFNVPMRATGACGFLTSQERPDLVVWDSRLAGVHWTMTEQEIDRFYGELLKEERDGRR